MEISIYLITDKDYTQDQVDNLENLVLQDGPQNSLVFQISVLSLASEAVVKDSSKNIYEEICGVSNIKSQPHYGIDKIDDYLKNSLISLDDNIVLAYQNIAFQNVIKMGSSLKFASSGQLEIENSYYATNFSQKEELRPNLLGSWSNLVGVNTDIQIEEEKLMPDPQNEDSNTSILVSAEVLLPRGVKTSPDITKTLSEQKKKGYPYPK